MAKRNLRRKGLASVSLRVVREGSSRQELKQGLWRRAAYQLASHDLLRLLCYTVQDNLSMVAPSIVSWVFPRWSSNKKIAYRLILRKRFLN